MSLPPTTVALLVLGPSHGTQVFLPSPPPDVYLVPAQPDLVSLVAVRDNPLVNEMTLPVHRYRRTMECAMRGHRGHFIYEHDGTTRT